MWAVVIFVVGDLLAMLLPALQAVHAERTLHTVGFACSLVAEYRESRGAWPQSFDDLRRVGLGESWLDHTWPEDADELQRRVAIDFASVPDDPCGAVGPIGNCYDWSRMPGYQRLQAVSDAERPQSRGKHKEVEPPRNDDPPGGDEELGGESRQASDKM